MSGFELTPEQVSLRELAAEVAREVYAPKAAEWDRDRTPLPDDEVQRLAKLGFLGMVLPEEYGGHGGTLLDALIVQEELAKECRPAAFQVFETNVGPCRVIEFFGTEQQKKDVLPKTVSGEITMAIGISEPDAGSAATDMRTKARLEGDEYVLNGSKRWISNGGHANEYLVYCRLSDAPGAKGIGAIRVAKGTPGFSFGAPEKLMGFRGIPSADLYFDDVRVPVRQPRHPGRRVQAAVRGVLHRAPRQRDDEPRDRPGVPGPHQGLRAGAQAVRSARSSSSRTCRWSSPTWPPRWRRPGCSSTARR